MIKNKDLHFYLLFFIIIGIILGTSLSLINWQMSKRNAIIASCKELMKQYPDTRNTRICKVFFEYCIKSTVQLEECKIDLKKCLERKIYE